MREKRLRPLSLKNTVQQTTNEILSFDAYLQPACMPIVKCDVIVSSHPIDEPEISIYGPSQFDILLQYHISVGSAEIVQMMEDQSNSKSNSERFQQQVSAQFKLI